MCPHAEVGRIGLVPSADGVSTGSRAADCAADEQMLAGTLTTEVFVERVRRGSRQFVEI